jgi:hypothetical protein
MKTKKPYVAKNIRAGINKGTAELRLKLNPNSRYVAPYKVGIRTYTHGRDVNGNRTAHYICMLQDARDACIMEIVSSGWNREQVGYSGQNGAALYALERLGYEVDTSNARHFDADADAQYPLKDFMVQS